MRKLAFALAALAVTPPIVGNVMQLAVGAHQDLAPLLAGLTVVINLTLAVLGRVAAARLVEEPAFDPGMRTVIVFSATTRVGVAAFAFLPLAAPTTQPFIATAMLICDLAFWTCVIGGISSLGGRGFAAAAAILYTLARTASLGVWAIEDEDLSMSFALAHRVLAIVAAGVMALLFVRVARSASAQAPRENPG